MASVDSHPCDSLGLLDARAQVFDDTVIHEVLNRGFEPAKGIHTRRLRRAREAKLERLSLHEQSRQKPPAHKICSCCVAFVGNEIYEQA